MFRFYSSNRLADSCLYDQNNFYKAFLKDLNKAKTELIIECRFITHKRAEYLLATLEVLTRRGVRVIINTKPLDELEANYREQAAISISRFQDVGITVLLTVGHHRKLAIIDRQILWEGSLNILSQNDSCEIMRRVDSHTLAKELLSFLDLDEFIRCYD